MDRWPNRLIHHSMLRAVLATFSFLCVFTLINGDMGHISPQLNQVLAIMSLAVLAGLIGIQPGQGLQASDKRWLAAAAAAFGVAVLLWAAGGEVERSLAVVFVLLGLDWAGRARDSAPDRIGVFLLAAMLITCYVLLLKYMPPFWSAVQLASRMFSHTVARATGQNLLLGATASGLHILVFFLLYVLSGFWLAEQRSWKRFAAICGLGVITNAVYIAIHNWTFVPVLKLFLNGYHLGHSHYRDYTITSLNTSVFLLGLLAIALFLLERNASAGERPVMAWQPRQWIAGFSLMLLGMALLVYTPASAAGGKVLLYDKGYMSWDKPAFGLYGERSSGMFGMLPDFLEASGYQALKSDFITEESLADVNTLVVINLQKPFSPDEHMAIWRFVERGGALLALADHTGLAGIREPFDELLKPVGIGVNFDSAHFIKDWDYGFELFPHPVTRGEPDHQQVGIMIGASLDIPARAAPIVTGKYGFADLGNANNSQNAYLGDRQYNRGEPLGDIVLAASVPYGKGKVLVFGDTSSFQNTALVTTHDFTRRVFDYLSRPVPLGKFSPLIKLGGLLLLALALVSIRARHVSAAVAALACAMLLGVVATSAISAIKEGGGRTFAGNIAYIDTSHLERLQMRLDNDESFLGLANNLMRNGFMPLAMSRFSEAHLRASKLFVAIAPAIPFSAAEIEAVKRFTNDGGTFILSSGWGDRRGSRRLLGAFGLEFENLPLGPVEPEENTAGVQFYNAWPIRADAAGDARVLCSTKTGDYPLVVERSQGAGRFILIGDTGFLRNGNLESFRAYLPENIAFLKGLLKPEGAATSVSLNAGGK